jgi:hypothetical protein
MTAEELQFCLWHALTYQSSKCPERFVMSILMMWRNEFGDGMQSQLLCVVDRHCIQVGRLVWQAEIAHNHAWSGDAFDHVLLAAGAHNLPLSSAPGFGG